jgi:hypothetical protein
MAQATANLVQLVGRQSAAAGAGSSGSSVQQQAAAAALAAVGVRVGELALALGRPTSTRDLIKWCARMVTGHGPLMARCLKQVDSSEQQQQQQQQQRKGSSKKQKRSKASEAAAAAAAVAVSSSSSSPRMVDLTRMDQALKLAAFAEASDVFAGVLAKPEAKLKLLAALAALWGCAGPADVALQYEELSKPTMDVGSNELQVWLCAEVYGGGVEGGVNRMVYWGVKGGGWRGGQPHGCADDSGGWGEGVDLMNRNAGLVWFRWRGTFRCRSICQRSKARQGPGCCPPPCLTD